jgi:VWFA-related protein
VSRTLLPLRGARARPVVAVKCGSRLGRIAKVSTVVGFASIPILAQPDRPSVVELSVDVRVVNVDAVVLDRRGRPVQGLRVDDFQLFVDGHEVAIAYFSAPPGELAYESGKESAIFPAPDRASPSPSAAATPSADILALLLDERLLPPGSWRRVVRDVKEFLSGAGSEFGRVVFARYRDRLELMVPQKGDEIAHELERLGPMAMAAVRGRELSRALQDIVASYEACEQQPFCAPCTDNWQEMMRLAETFGRLEELRVALAVDALAEFISWLAGLDGEKLLLYPSDGLPHRPGIEAYAFVIDICRDRRADSERDATIEMLQFDESRRLRHLGAWANARGVRLFPLESSGLRTGATASVEFARADLRPSSRFDEVVRSNAQSGLYQLADETGGKPIFNSNQPLLDLDLRPEIEGRYVLGFAPDHPPTGRRHELKVELRSGRKLEVRHRRSYFDRTLDQRLADELQSALRLGHTPNPLGAALSFGTVTADPAAAGSFLVPVRIEVDEERLLAAASPAASGGAAAPRGRLRVWLGALRDDDTRTAVRQEVFELGPEGVVARDGRYRITVTMSLGPGRWTVAAGLRDELAQASSLVRGEVEVAGAPASPTPRP